MKTCSCNQDGPIHATDGRTFLVLSWCIGNECKRHPCGHVKDWMKRHVVMHRTEPYKRPEIREVPIEGAPAKKGYLPLSPLQIEMQILMAKGIRHRNHTRPVVTVQTIPGRS